MRLFNFIANHGQSTVGAVDISGGTHRRSSCMTRFLSARELQPAKRQRGLVKRDEATRSRKGANLHIVTLLDSKKKSGNRKGFIYGWRQSLTIAA